MMEKCIMASYRKLVLERLEARDCPASGFNNIYSWISNGGVGQDSNWQNAANWRLSGNGNGLGYPATVNDCAQFQTEWTANCKYDGSSSLLCGGIVSNPAYTGTINLAGSASMIEVTAKIDLEGSLSFTSTTQNIEWGGTFQIGTTGIVGSDNMVIQNDANALTVMNITVDSPTIDSKIILEATNTLQYPTTLNITTGSVIFGDKCLGIDCVKGATFNWIGPSAGLGSDVATIAGGAQSSGASIEIGNGCVANIGNGAYNTFRTWMAFNNDGGTVNIDTSNSNAGVTLQISNYTSNYITSYEQSQTNAVTNLGYGCTIYGDVYEIFFQGGTFNSLGDTTSNGKGNLKSSKVFFGGTTINLGDDGYGWLQVAGALSLSNGTVLNIKCEANGFSSDYISTNGSNNITMVNAGQNGAYGVGLNVSYVGTRNGVNYSYYPLVAGGTLNGGFDARVLFLPPDMTETSNGATIILTN
jgi:hypothetical protein